MMKEKFKSVHFWLVVGSFMLYISSMFFTPFYVANPKADIYSNSFYMLLAGWMAILGGGLIPTIIWLANPLYFFGGFLILNKEKFAIIPVTLSLILAIYFASLNSIMDGESGATTNITALGSGYYLWLLSIIALFIAAIMTFFKKTPSSNFS
ncbi:hypothetical protein [Kaistella jeonii]|uniref:hypothetical protein n=1 Tax=Kaistella jeonii TaxID=266749 RepID=UPI00068CD919|nr:hypothetical protein [Kaistella jeonii]SFB68852.1 hypothetical protein SAMN05421876_10176 [Kaistella jeonii]VEI94681.1 Uncharacterised protein [Kaistella jeonii]